MNHLIIEALNECLREQNTELKAELASAKAVIEAARIAQEFLPGGDTIKPGRSAHVDASVALRAALAAYDARGK